MKDAIEEIYFPATDNDIFNTWYEEFGQYYVQDKDALKAAYIAGSQLRAMQGTDLESLKREVETWIDEMAGYNGWTSSHRERDMSVKDRVIDHLASQGRITCKQNATTKGNDDE